MATSTGLIDALRASAEPLESDEGLDALLERLARARFVLIGEESHGTAEFYRTRAVLTRRLIEERGFHAVAIEGDWPDASRVSRYVHGQSDDHSAREALSGFSKFPAWMWRNSEVLAFVEWLRGFNASARRRELAGFYGLDLYSLHTSAEAVVEYLEQVDPEAARVARGRYACFDPFVADIHDYARASAFSRMISCEGGAVQQLVDLLHQRDRYLAEEGARMEDAFFDALRNAQLVRNAEGYYRTMYRGGTASWNLRDQHMADTFQALVDHLDARVGQSRVVVWAHSSHLGDARATDFGWAQGQLNLGQLIRAKYPHDTFILGQTTYVGAVTAARDWGEPARLMRVNEGLRDSYEALFHEIGLSAFWLDLRDLGEAAAALREQRLERAIGVVYSPRTERHSHYFHARMPEQFDAVVHFDRTQALQPLDPGELWRTGEPPETYPSSL